MATVLGFAPLTAAGPGLAQEAAPPSGMATNTWVKDGTTCRTEMVPMRDGTRLYTEIYLPAGSETATPVRRPVVVIRTPYGSTGLPEGCFRSPVGAPKIDAVTIVQSVRGTGSSEGEFVPIRHERDDGVDGSGRGSNPRYA